MDDQGIHYCCSRSLLVRGPEALHHDYAARVERALGQALPQMEVRVSGLSLSTAESVAASAATHELPTVATTFKKLLGGGRAQSVDKVILHKVYAHLQPGTMTLVLGQPGAGKSSLLKMLSGRFPASKHVRVEGDVSYNGVTRQQMGDRLPQFVSYVGQRDCHFPTLTVKETLEFAHECCGAELTKRDEKHFVRGSPEENKAALEAARSIYRHYPEIVTKQLGLEHCQDTIVGDAMLRGISGGERKRVTTGEMDFGNKYVAFLDEISTGLDSAATYDIVKTQRSMAKKLRKTIVMALLQPAPEVFDLFDNVMVLSQGYVLYNGPRAQIVEYFKSLGFVCPPDREVAEFLLDLGTSKQDQYVRARGSASLLPSTPQDFARVFETSFIFQQTIAQLLHSPSEDLRDDVFNHFAHMPEFHQSFWASTLTLLNRELKVTWRNKALIKGRAAVLCVIGLIYSLLFYQFDDKNPQVVIGTIFPAILFFTLGQSAQLPRFMDARQIFYKQRGANFYRSSSYVIATALNQVPLAFIESVIFSSVVYFLCGFVNDVTAFAMFVFIVFLTNLAFAAWFFLLSALCPNKHIGEPVGMLSILLYTLFAGFIITHQDIPVYFTWVYWINPVSWAVRSLAINQYGNRKFDTCIYQGINYCALFDNTKMGKYSLGTYDIYAQEYWIWFGVVFMIASFGVYMVLAGVVLEKIRHAEVTHAGVAVTQEAIPIVSVEDELAIKGETPKTVYRETQSPREFTMDVLTGSSGPAFVPVTLAFKDLSYSVPNPTNPKEDLELLRGISGFALPGTMTALMGSSGAGKTTLMDVIAGRKTGGKIRGQILLNGHEATDLAIRRSTGYCEQMDIHSEATTFREALIFSAFLRQGADVSDAQKYESVEECLDLLGLRPIADKIVRGSSVEQMKRLTIGVELAAQPSVLFLDEPTSGLDASSAKLIMEGVRKVADTGRTVVCTIHQPSWDVFRVFDSLLLLKRGGETVYFGELGHNAVEIVKYFESIHGVEGLQRGYNPATWMLEVIGAGVGNTAGQNTDFVSIFNHSAKKAEMDRVLGQDGVSRPAHDIPMLEFTSKRAATEATQAKLLVGRFLTMYWRTPAYNVTRMTVYIVLALVFGLAFGQIDYTTYRGINSGVGMLFISSLFVGVISFKSVKPLMFDDRGVFYRERAAQTYNALWYFVGSTVAEIPYVFVAVLLFCAIFFPLVGFSGFLSFLRFWLHLSLHVLFMTFLGQFLSFALPTLELSATISTMVVAIIFLFMGYNPPAKSIPVGYKWLHAITPPKYTLAILSSVVFGDCEKAGDVACHRLADLPPTVPKGITVAQYIDEVFHANYDDIWQNFAVVVGAIVLFRVLALLALRYLNHQKR